MPNPIIQSYLNDRSVDINKRRYVIDQIKNGTAEDELATSITRKYGDKYGTLQPTPTQSSADMAGTVAKGIVGAFNPANFADNARNLVTNVVPKAVQAYGKTVGPITPEQEAEIEQKRQEANRENEKVSKFVQQNENPDFGEQVKRFLFESPVEVGIRGNKNLSAEEKMKALDQAKNPIVRYGENTASAANQNLEQAGSGGSRFFKGMNPFDQSQSLQERNANIAGGFSDVVSGAIGTAFSPVTGGVESLPEQVKEPIKGAMNFAFNEVPTTAVKKFAQLIRPDLDVEDPQFQETVIKPFQAAMQTYLTIGAPGAKAVINKAGERVGGKLKQAGEKLYDSAIKPNVKEAELLQRKAAGVANKTGKSIEVTTRAKTALEKGIKGTEKSIGKQAVLQSNKLYKEKIAPALKQSKEIITREELFAPLEAKIKKIVEPGRKSELQKALEAIKEEYASSEFGQLSLSKAQKIKQGLDEFTPQKAFKGEEIGSAYNQLRKDLADVIRNKTYNKLKDVNIRKDFIDYGNLLELEKVGIKARTASGTKGGFGSFWSSAWEMVATPVKTKGGQTLYRIGNKLEVIGPENIKTFGEILQSQGLTKTMYQKLIKIPKVKLAVRAGVAQRERKD